MSDEEKKVLKGEVFLLIFFILIIVAMIGLLIAIEEAVMMINSLPPIIE